MNKLDLICIIAMGVFLLLWVIGCVIRLVVEINKSYKDTPFIYHVTCSLCHREFDAQGKDIRGVFYRQRSTTKTRVRKGAFVNATNYRYYARKIYCPDCQKVRWCQIRNIEDARANQIGNSGKLVVKTILRMLIGGMIILILSRVLVGILYLSLSIFGNL